jgi:hypothetical protein
MAGRYQFARNTKYFFVVIVLNVSRFIVVPKFLGGTARYGDVAEWSAGSFANASGRGVGNG